MTYQLTCMLCGLEGRDLVRMQEHVMRYHGYSQRELQANTHRNIDGGYIYTMPDGRDWLRALREG